MVEDWSIGERCCVIHRRVALRSPPETCRLFHRTKALPCPEKRTASWSAEERCFVIR